MGGSGAIPDAADVAAVKPGETGGDGSGGISESATECWNACVQGIPQLVEPLLVTCRTALKTWLSSTADAAESAEITSPLPGADCAHCQRHVREFAQGKHGLPLCRSCLRAEDEENFEPLTEEERRGLDLVAGVLDSVPWTHWKPGEQPAALLDWFFLGDLDEAMDLNLLNRKGITAVVNLVNWWELISKRPDVPDLWQYYSSQGIQYSEGDSEDRLFFDIVGKSWPPAEQFIERCHKEGLKVIVNCKAGHNRSACIVLCWLIVHEKMDLLDALRLVLERRGCILSNHGFRLQLVRLALKLGRLDHELEACQPSPRVVGTTKVWREQKQSSAEGKSPGRELWAKVDHIIKKKRLSVAYDQTSTDFGTRSTPTKLAAARALFKTGIKGNAAISEEVGEWVSERSLSIELLACLWHKGKKFSVDYEYTTDPPTVIGSGFSGDVVLCRHRDSRNFKNAEASVRCVKSFDLRKMKADTLAKLKNEAVICMSLEHPNIARLFDAYEDAEEVSLVMQYCSGGTLEVELRKRGRYTEPDFQDVSVQTLRALSYIHSAGIVHRDIKPRNFVYEAGVETIKLIDFGFSVKNCLQAGDGDRLQGCMGTLGYLAPEVVRCIKSAEFSYNEKCDLWSLGAVFYELLTGVPAYHREQGQCDGYTEEVVLREIEEATPESVTKLLADVPPGAKGFLARLMTIDPEARPPAKTILNDSYLAGARAKMRNPPNALKITEVLMRFNDHGRASKPTRAFLLAQARSPTSLPWKEFLQLRDTFKMFDAHELTGTIGLAGFLAVVAPSDQSAKKEVTDIWNAVCGEQESLSYCEFIAALLPPIEDVFQDVGTSEMSMTRAVSTGQVSQVWDPSMPISKYLHFLSPSDRPRKKLTIFEESRKVADVMQDMFEAHLRWAIVRYVNGPPKFIDYMDISNYLATRASSSGVSAAAAAAQMGAMVIGAVANVSGHATYVPQSANTPLAEILKAITAEGIPGAPPVRRVPIVDKNGEVLDVFSCLDFLTLACRFAAPTAILKSRSARAFDRRETIMSQSVLLEDSILDAFRIMDQYKLTICPATCKKLSGDLGGVVTSNVVSVSDLKWVFHTQEFGILDSSVSEFLTWRAGVAACSENHRLREQQRSRFNVVSVDEDDSLFALAKRLLASKLQRIFLSSEELARIVGIVSSRDILFEVLDSLL